MTKGSMGGDARATDAESPDAESRDAESPGKESPGEESPRSEVPETVLPPTLPNLACIVAVARNGVIGDQGDLPWRLKADLQRFRRETMGHHLVMGRKTWESIGRALPGRTSWVLSRGEPKLPKGVHLVRTVGEIVDLCSGAARTGGSLASETAVSETAVSEAAVSEAGVRETDPQPSETTHPGECNNMKAERSGSAEGKRVFCIGGAQLYRCLLPMASELLLTRVEADVKGDVFFPVIDCTDSTEWIVVEEQEQPADSENQYPTTFFRYRRRNSTDSAPLA